MIVGAYERFLELPVAVVVGVLWLVGSAMLAALGTCALALSLYLYLYMSLLAGT
jgi:hypothetical protein